VSAHLGPELAALVDGELDHAARERVLRHLTGCLSCRAEVEDHRQLKARLLGLMACAPDPGTDLSERLRALGGASEDLVLSVGRGPLRPPTAPRARRGPRGPRGRGRRLPRSAVGGAVLVLGLGVVLALGAPHQGATRTPVDPTSDAFLVDYANTSGELPLPEPAGVSSAGFGR